MLAFWQQILQCNWTVYTFNKPQQLLQIHLDIKKYGSRAPLLTMIELEIARVYSRVRAKIFSIRLQPIELAGVYS